MDDTVLRDCLVKLLQAKEAHASARQAIQGLKPELRNVRPQPDVHSVWEDLEHMRIAQEDILRYTLDATWKSPDWPGGYWPPPAQQVTDEMWETSVTAFFSDLEEVIKLVSNTTVDLTAPIPHGEGKTYLREVFLVADHNAYHVGQIVQTRKLLGDWSS
jgi:hypothetical protein